MRRGVGIARSGELRGSGNPLRFRVCRGFQILSALGADVALMILVHFWSAAMTYYTSNYPGRKLDLLTGYIEIALLIGGCVTGLIAIIL